MFLQKIKPMKERNIKADILVELSKYENIIVWNNPTGLFFTKTGIPVKVNTPGAADILGLIDGRFIAIETKTLTGRQRESQKAWEKNIVERGKGIYILARSVEDAISGLEKHNLINRRIDNAKL